MKLFVISDIHGSYKYASLALKKFNASTYSNLVILGDLYYHGPRNPLPEGYAPMDVSKLLNQYQDKIIAIKGNCDAEVDQMISLFTIQDQYVMTTPSNKKIGFIHGHHGFDSLGSCDLYLSGHTHISVLKKENGKVYANPGSISLPKAEKSRNYIIVDDDKISVYDLLTDELIGQMEY